MNCFLRYPQGKSKALTFSYDDGVIQDARLIDIFNKYGLKGTFNVNSNLFGRGDRLAAEEVKLLYLQNGQELACHGFNHPFLEKLPDNLALYEIIKDRCTLEQLTDTIIQGFAYPYGTTSDATIALLHAAGICYARDVRSTGKFVFPDNWFRWQPTCHHDDPRLFDLAQDFLSRNMHSVGTDGLLFYVWGHAYEFDNKDNWARIEQFAAMISEKKDIWYATNMEIYRYVTAFRRLEFSMDHHTAYNPSDTDVWFAKRESPFEPLEIICVPAGQIIRL